MSFSFIRELNGVASNSSDSYFSTIQLSTIRFELQDKYLTSYYFSGTYTNDDPENRKYLNYSFDWGRTDFSLSNGKKLAVVYTYAGGSKLLELFDEFETDTGVDVDSILPDRRWSGTVTAKNATLYHNGSFLGNIIENTMTFNFSEIPFREIVSKGAFFYLKDNLTYYSGIIIRSYNIEVNDQQLIISLTLENTSSYNSYGGYLYVRPVCDGLVLNSTVTNIPFNLSPKQQTTVTGVYVIVNGTYTSLSKIYVQKTSDLYIDPSIQDVVTFES